MERRTTTEIEAVGVGYGVMRGIQPLVTSYPHSCSSIIFKNEDISVIITTRRYRGVVLDILKELDDQYDAIKKEL